MIRASKKQRKKCPYRGHARTDPAFVRALEIHHGIKFDLDAMADDQEGGHVASAGWYLTPEDDALAPWTRWPGHAVFCNPPFDTTTYLRAMSKAYQQAGPFMSAGCAVVVLPASCMSNASFDLIKEEPPDSITIWTPRVNFMPHPLSEMYLEAVAAGKEPKGQANGGTMTLFYSPRREPTTITRVNWIDVLGS